jgi:hypothetical protein
MESIMLQNNFVAMCAVCAMVGFALGVIMTIAKGGREEE